MVLEGNWIGGAVLSPIVDIRRELVFYQLLFYSLFIQYIAYSPNTSPIDIDIINDRIELTSDVVILAVWKYDIASMTTLVECFENVGNIIGGASVGKDSALRSVADF